MIDLNVTPVPHKRSTWWATLRMLWPYQRQFLVPFIIGVVLIGADLVFEVGIAVVQQYFFAAMKPGHLRELLNLARDCGCIGLGLVLLTAVQHFCRNLATAYAGRALNVDMLQKVHRFPYAWLQRFHSADLVSRLNNDTGLANNLLSSLIFDVFYQILLGVVALCYLLSINATAAITAVLVGHVFFSPRRLFARRIRRYSEKVQEQDASIRARVQEALQEMAAIRAYGLEARTAADYVVGRTEQNRLKLRREWMQSVMWQLVTLAQGSAQVFSAVLVAQGALHGVVSPGQVMTFVFLMGNVQQPFMRMSRVWNDIQKSLGASDRLNRLDFVPQEKQLQVASQGPHRSDPRENAYAIEIRHATFTPGRENAMVGWTDPLVLHETISTSESLFSDLNLTIKPQETVALVGASGAGKTSVARLICGLYRPEQGEVIIGGVSMREDPERARTHLSVVPQNPHLFSGTIKDNIAFGSEHATDYMIELVARRAQVHEFVKSLENGYDTVIGEQGYKLSGGQRQRIAIARALLRDAPILILDEPTSALDNETERAIQSALEQLTHKKTLVIIAHRLSTIRHADRIIVFERGRAVEEGTHAELLRLKGPYAKLFELQTE